MIARHWRGWTTRGDAETYEALLKQRVLPGLAKLDGYRGGYVLREDSAGETEFVVINLFDSLDAVKRFAGFRAGSKSVAEPHRADGPSLRSPRQSCGSGRNLTRDSQESFLYSMSRITRRRSAFISLSFRRSISSL